MRAFTLDSFEATPSLREDLPVPDLGEGEVLVRIHASSVNPVDAYTAMGALKGMIEYEFPVILGRDLAGVVERIGAGVIRYAVGDEVFGWAAKPVLHDGTYADYIALPADQFTAPKPASVDFVAAATVPLAASTASIALDALNLAHGDRVLVVGATGGVGSFFVQLAADRGAQVIATGLAQDEAYLRDLGAAEIVERGEDVAAAVRQRHPDGVDALFDLVSREPADFAALAAAVKPAGRAASALGAAGSDLPGGITASNVMNASQPARLQQLAGLIDAGTLRSPVQRTYPLAQVGEAFADLQGQHTQGKLAITIA
jgi:NADPH:quinone reductase-like Zn-dependent oxidoreductase